jgi:hypothetical protein
MYDKQNIRCEDATNTIIKFKTQQHPVGIIPNSNIKIIGNILYCNCSDSVVF